MESTQKKKGEKEGRTRIEKGFQACFVHNHCKSLDLSFVTTDLLHFRGCHAIWLILLLFDMVDLFYH